SAGTIGIVVGTILGAPADLFPTLNRVLVNASVTKLAIGSTGTNLISFNDHSHLELVDRALGHYRSRSPRAGRGDRSGRVWRIRIGDEPDEEVERLGVRQRVAAHHPRRV